MLLFSSLIASCVCQSSARSSSSCHAAYTSMPSVMRGCSEYQKRSVFCPLGTSVPLSCSIPKGSEKLAKEARPPLLRKHFTL